MLISSIRNITLIKDNNVNFLIHAFLRKEIQMENLEIERKYLVNTENIFLERYPHKKITQGYIYDEKFTEIRIRKVENESDIKYFYTVKISGNNAIQRNEIEFEITEEQFNSLLPKILDNTHFIEKDRYLIPIENDLIAELDIYSNQLEGLSTVEVEFPNLEVATNFQAPEWFGIDITSNKSYKNKNLAKIGFQKQYRKDFSN